MSGSADGSERLISPGTLLTVGCALVVISAPLSAWLTRSSTDRWLGSAGFSLAVSGLVLSLVGFAVTLWQLRRADSATRAVAGAVSRLRRDLSSLDVLTELRSAAEAAGEAQNHLREQKWQAALFSYNKVRHSLYKTIAAIEKADEKSAEIVRDFIAHALGAIAILEAAGVDGTEVNSSIMSSKLRDLEGFIVPLEYKMKDSFGDQQ